MGAFEPQRGSSDGAVVVVVAAAVAVDSGGGGGGGGGSIRIRRANACNLLHLLVLGLGIDRLHCWRRRYNRCRCLRRRRCHGGRVGYGVVGSARSGHGSRRGTRGGDGSLARACGRNTWLLSGLGLVARRRGTNYTGTTATSVSRALYCRQLGRLVAYRPRRR